MAKVTIDLSKNELQQFSDFCYKNGMYHQDLFHELTGTDEEEQGDEHYLIAERWFKLEETFKEHLPKRKA